MHMNLIIIGHRLRGLRKSIGVSRRKIEEKHNISANTIKVWEAGKSEIGIMKLAYYLEVFKEYGISVSVDHLLDFEQNNYLDKLLEINNSVLNHNITDNLPGSNNVKDLVLISETVQQATDLLLENNKEMLQALFDHIPVNIVFKDEFNNILEINSLAAHDVGGTVRDFEKKMSMIYFLK